MVMTASRVGASQYHDVEARLRAAIESGAYPRGTKLPTEDELAAQFGVHRATVNRALGILRADGLVYVHRGKGTFVTEIPPIHRNAVTRYSREARERSGGRGAFDTEIRAMGRTPRSDLTVTRGRPPQRVADILGTSAEEDSCLIRGRRMYADDTPVQIADSYIPLDIAAGTALEDHDSGPGGIVSRFADLGFAQVRITERLGIRPPAAEEADFLGMSPDQRVLDITHIGWTAEGRAVEVCLHVMPAHQWDLEYEWPADPIAP
jgi:GntR family transcriptional regulator